MDSVTAIPRQRFKDEARDIPLVIVAGNAEQVATPPEQRLITFARTLWIGRRSRKASSAVEDSGATWVAPDRLVSSKHASIAGAGGAGGNWTLTDLGSTNGTIVDGARAQPARPLRDGSLIFAGSHALVFRLVAASQLAAIREELADPLGPVPTCNPDFAVTCAKLKKLADTDGEVLLTGETGVGKEVYAAAIHKRSGRRGRLVAVNCAAIPRELVESELFGYARGAHSQATAAKMGLIEEADGGTLFLDEIGEMSSELQAKLLRFTQDKMLTPVGGTRPRQMDVRILAATSRSVAAIGSGGQGLRLDLAARLGAEPVRIPPLRERIEDLAGLCAALMGDRSKAMEILAFQALCLHAWPGNVRELEKVLSTAEALARGAERITIDHLPKAIAAGPHRIRSSPIGRNARPAPSKLELEDAIRRCEGNMARVARELGRKAPLLYRWAKRFNIDINAYRREPLPAGAMADGTMPDGADGDEELDLADDDDDDQFGGTSPDLGEDPDGDTAAGATDDERDAAGE